MIAATHTPTAARRTGQRSWRAWNIIGLTALTAYSTALGWQAQFVSYPLFREVPADAFAAYHERYNATIPAVVIVPGFVTFLAGTAFWWTRPHGVARSLAALVSVSGLVSILTTVCWAIPEHDELDRTGPAASTIDSLIDANLVRTLALSASTVGLCVALRRLVRTAAIDPR